MDHDHRLIKQEQLTAEVGLADLVDEDDETVDPISVIMECADDDDEDEETSGPIHDLGDVIIPAEPVENQPTLEKLPRPVNDLNCRMSRAYLVKLLRAANGGQNPAYGNPEKKPPFWPDYYWPWERLTDVHTKPKDMNEPLQYSEMMKIAISRGYQYYGYDPDEYVDPTVDLSEKQNPVVTPPACPSGSNKDKTKTNFKHPMGKGKVPPRLPRPASKLNCVQARCSLSKLLRYQQQGNNPVYGSPDTQPPWWPEECIRWCDMVDLRGKPPYLPDQKSYVDVLRLAVCRAVEYYGYDPETYIEIEPTSSIAASSIVQHPSSTVNVSKKIPILQPINLPNVVTEIKIDPTLPPRLSAPIKQMNCSTIRISLSKLLWFNNKNMPPQYGSALSMPVWWPNHLMEWTKMKNLRHKYEGPLGNTYTNCLRTALILGYAHYGLDPNQYVEPTSAESIVVEPVIYENDDDYNVEEDIVIAREEKVPQPIIHQPLKKILKPVPPLLPLNKVLKTSQEEKVVTKLHDQSLLDTPGWFPPKLIDCSCWASNDDIASLKKCKVVVDRAVVDSRSEKSEGEVRVTNKVPTSVIDLFRQDLAEKKFTDLVFVSGGDKPFYLHKFVVAAHSAKMKKLMRENDDQETCVHFADIDSEELELLVKALYLGEVSVQKEKADKFMDSLRLFQEFGMLRHLHCVTASSTRKHIIDKLHAEVVTNDAVESEHISSGESETDKLNQLTVEVSTTDKVLDLYVECVASSTQSEVITDVSNKADEELIDVDSIELNTSEITLPTEVKSATLGPNKKTTTEVNTSTKRTSSSRKSTLSSLVESATPAKDSAETREEGSRGRAKRVTKKRKIQETESPNVKRAKVVAAPNLDQIDKKKLNTFVKKSDRDFAKWLLDCGLLIPPPYCPFCSADCVLIEDASNPDGVSWCCSKSPKRGVNKHAKGVSVRTGSLFERCKKEDSLKWIMKVVLCWKDNTSLNECQMETGVDVDRIFALYDACTEFFVGRR